MFSPLEENWVLGFNDIDRRGNDICHYLYLPLLSPVVVIYYF